MTGKKKVEIVYRNNNISDMVGQLEARLGGRGFSGSLRLHFLFITIK